VCSYRILYILSIEALSFPFFIIIFNRKRKKKVGDTLISYVESPQFDDIAFCYFFRRLADLFFICLRTPLLQACDYLLLI